MNKHPRTVDAATDELAAIHEAFEWAVDVLGLLPADRAALVRIAHAGGAGHRSPAVAAETMMRHIIAIADDVQALIGDEDQILEWLRSPNPGLWSGSPIPRMTTPLRVLLDHPDGVRAIHAQLDRERGPGAWRGFAS